MASKLKFSKIIPIVWITLIFSIIYFIYTLGFMTPFYDFFYGGTESTYQYYKELQVVNKYMFNASIILVLGSIFCLITGISRKKRNWFWIATLGLVNVLAIIRIVVLLQTIPTFIDKYNGLDFGSLQPLEDPSLFMNMSIILPTIIVIFMMLIMFKNLLNTSKGAKES
ncbi:hypothetical protein SAMN05421839_13019 [Halolactibacillus halophilus]|uniref:Uncharacterized protein n=1 Tax=Halolactibacillus halophilus TaxID=306540 RepID=A0A1I5RHY7_9BACI|nr:hypothetical protein [Halolactibacillus halophilus]GEM02359.1 hypothetical protein HHA03_18910 [Halolactibacillus halophilus]SFP57980.1 hypothetical protein SAMN05421839_13019 [Halolactibacillus halophilus]